MSGNTASAGGAAPAGDQAVAAFVAVTGATTAAADHYLGLPTAGGDLQVAVGLYFQAEDAHGSGDAFGGAAAPGDTGAVEAFTAATNATPAVAAGFLEMAGGDLAMAVSLYLDDGPDQPADAPSGTGVGAAVAPAAKRHRTDAHPSGNVPREGTGAAAQRGGAVREFAEVAAVAADSATLRVGCVPAPPFAALGFLAGPHHPRSLPRASLHEAAPMVPRPCCGARPHQREQAPTTTTVAVGLPCFRAALLMFSRCPRAMTCALCALAGAARATLAAAAGSVHGVAAATAGAGSVASAKATATSVHHRVIQGANARARVWSSLGRLAPHVGGPPSLRCSGFAATSCVPTHGCLLTSGLAHVCYMR